MSYTKQIEKDFEVMVEKHNNREKRKGHTGCKDVLQFLVENEHKIWWWSWEFVNRETEEGGYLSHRAPARASDLALHHGLLEDRKIGRYKVYRLRVEKAKEIILFMVS